MGKREKGIVGHAKPADKKKSEKGFIGHARPVAVSTDKVG